MHVTPFWPMTIVFIALVILTILTVVFARIPASQTVHIVIALVIAITKGTLVMAYFMHLKYDKGMPLVTAFATYFGVLLFLGFTLIDIGGRRVENRINAQEIVAGGNLETAKKALPYQQEGTQMNQAEWARQQAAADAGNPDDEAPEEAASEDGASPAGAM